MPSSKRQLCFMSNCIYLLFFGLSLNISSTFVSGAPCYIKRIKETFYYVSVCTCYIWPVCWHHGTVRRATYRSRTTCCPGYMSDCSTPICGYNCHGHGSCVAPHVCSCRRGYAGSYCERAVCNPRCVHGYCISPNRCHCYNGYTGQRCDQPICSPGCENGGSCVSPNTCQCSNGYMGRFCQQAICNPPCLNGGRCVKKDVCQCTNEYNGNSCEKAICNPPCENGGTCVQPNECACRETYIGSRCSDVRCSYNYPCFPGTCAGSTRCTCKAEFSGSTGNDLCKTMNRYAAPTIATCSATLANIERTGQKRELYRFMTDASAPNSSLTELMWVNQKDYNYINISFAAFYTTAVINHADIPNYIRNFSFGIVGGKVITTLKKVPRKGLSPSFVSINKTIANCTHQPGSMNPEEHLYNCEITYPNFDRLLEHADNLTLTVQAESGGFRQLIKRSTETGVDIDIYNGQITSKDMMFRFDFHKPFHCALNHSCSSNPNNFFTVEEDITKNAVKFQWRDWVDELSGIDYYIIEAFHLKPDNQISPSLTETNARQPFETFKIHSSKRSFEFTPPSPGMYSFVLNVIDLANNTQCSRTLVLYDPVSSVTTNESFRIRAVSAAAETGYDWQSNLNGNIILNWKGYFQNQFHDQQKLLISVKKFQKIDWLKKLITKFVPDQLDDKHGKRTTAEIDNAHGIVNFKYSINEESSWTDIPNIKEEKLTFNLSRNDGDSVKVSVRATDVLGNFKIDSTAIHFDSTQPDMENVHFHKNLENVSYPFASRVHLEAYDLDSGIFKIDWKLSANDTGVQFKTGSIPGNKTSARPKHKLGYCVKMGNCFNYNYNFDINNCWLVVSKDKLKTQFVRLEIVVFNMAFLSKTYNMTITNLTSLEGMHDYSGPMHLHVAKKLDNGVRLKWTLSPSCYKRSQIRVIYKAAGGAFKTLLVDKDADWIDLTGLDPETNYTLEFVTAYGQQQSDPIALSFITSPAKRLLTDGVIAGISIVIIILIGFIVVGIILWRTGRLSVAKEGIQRRMSVYASRINKRISRNPAYGTEEDDIYLYGQMEFNNADAWVVSHNDIVLETLLTSGRFADIYKARYHTKKNTKHQIVAKVLRNGFSEEMELTMKAKINFFATKVGDDPNVLQFIGGVIDNESLGPYLLLEFCEKGQLRNWLLLQKNDANDETIERLYRISYGISKGMNYLENKKIVHRRLAARNILLNDTLEPKVAGFGPDPNNQDSNDEDGGAGERERIPIKWTAPECLLSMKSVTTKNDVWSFGIVLWEIYSLGETPYPDIRSRDVQAHVKSGHRLPKPEFANDFFYKVMSDCWHTKPKQRPTFRDITADIGKMFNVGPSDEFYYYSQK